MLMTRSHYLIIVAFIIGILSGYIYRDIFAGFLSSSVTEQYCPDPAGFDPEKESAWTVDNLNWSLYYKDNGSVQGLTFYQVNLEIPGNKLICQYRFSKQDALGAYGTVMLQLNPKASENITSLGEHWKKTPALAFCSAGDRKTCAFGVLEKG